MNIRTKAPIRVDLAGGTVDIWPLYLLLKNSRTINLGIDLYAETTLSSQSGSGEVKLKSRDLQEERRCSWDDLENVNFPNSLRLHAIALQTFRDRMGSHTAPKNLSKTNLTISTQARSPAGAGLGGSSSLLMSILGAVAHFFDDPIQHDREGMIDLAQDIESEILGVPAGLQDSYGGAFGGLQSIRWKRGGHDRFSFSPPQSEPIANRLMLFYSGKTRNSGINNWDVYKKALDGDRKILDRLNGIVEQTVTLEKAIQAQDFDRAAEAIREEWNLRVGLSAGIATPEMLEAFQKAEKHGVHSFKVCGAGGGGCFFLFLKDLNENLKKSLVQEITGQGVEFLPFSADHEGLVLEERDG